MKYLEGVIPKTKQQLLDRIASAMLRVPRRHFPEDYGHDFEGTFYSIERGVGNLRRKIGDNKADQLLEMLSQAKAHYETGDNKLGGSLMEDTKMVLMDRQPWAYPKELYRWGEDVSLPELSEVDLLNKGD